MKKILFTLLTGCLSLLALQAQNIPCLLENERQTPYPQERQLIYVNPAPLLVPQNMKQSDLLQFNLSQDPHFQAAGTQLSQPVPWLFYNAHQRLESGKWYWRVRSVSQDGQTGAWSEVYSFEMKADVPVFVTPTADLFLENVLKRKNRIYCFLEGNLEKARKQVRQHPEFERMIDDARDALAIHYRTETKPYSKIAQMYASCDKLNTAYLMTLNEKYAHKMVENVRFLLAAQPSPMITGNDFSDGEMAYLLACTYETCRDHFTAKEKKQLEEKLLYIIEQYYHKYILGYEETHLFDNHFWQFSFRHFLQAALVLADAYPLAKEYLTYSYELWTARAPASGFNRDGAWHNGPNYFSANAVSLCYVPTLFSYLTHTDFLQHPWYQKAGLALTYSWMPNACSNGFGDGHEKTNGKPLRIRSAFADFIARTTGDPYAAWYSSVNNRYLEETETRLYRMASGKQRPATSELPAEAPKAVWFKDCGEMIANSHLHQSDDNLSLSFRSSAFGSGSHTHSNQNAFNLQYGGNPVFYSVGHYMNFSDPHNLLSYRHTRAHNTILVDSMGQPFTTRAYGQITEMIHNEYLAYAQGDASHAYCGISEYPMWKRNFAAHGLEQSRKNGFGATPLKKYNRHILLLYPNIVVIYDELEASKAVTWDWLLHSPTQFDIQPEKGELRTKNADYNIQTVTQLFSNQSFQLSQTNSFIAEPNEKIAERGEDFTRPWSLTAHFEKSKTNRILTIIQVKTKEANLQPLIREGNRIRCGNWMIETELNSRRHARLHLNQTSTGYQLKIQGKNIQEHNKK